MALYILVEAGSILWSTLEASRTTLTFLDIPIAAKSPEDTRFWSFRFPELRHLILYYWGEYAIFAIRIDTLKFFAAPGSPNPFLS